MSLNKNINTHFRFTSGRAVGRAKFDTLLLNKSSRLPSPEEYVYLLCDIVAISRTAAAAAAGFPLQFKLIESSNHPEAQAVGSAYLIMFSSNKTFVEKLNITVSWAHHRTMHM